MKLFAAFLTFSLIFGNCPAVMCFYGGFIKGPTSFLEGSTFFLTCSIDLNDTFIKNGSYTSKDILFTYKNSTKIVNNERTQIIVVNESSAMLKFINATQGSHQIFCVVDNGFRRSGVSSIYIAIGTPPKKAESLNCISYNWQNLFCELRTKDNFVRPKYTMRYRVSGDAIYNADLHQVDDTVYQMNFTFNSDQPYRPAHEYYHFMLTASNSLGSFEENFTINNFESMVPDAVEELFAKNISHKDALITWKCPYLIKTFPRPFTYEVRISNEYERDDWKIFDSINSRAYEFNKTVPLVYPHTWYDVQIRMKVGSLSKTTHLWSKFANVVFVSKPAIPYRPPTVTTGSFFIHDDGMMSIFYKDLTDKEKNGKNYQVEFDIGDNKTSVQPVEPPTTMAKFSQHHRRTDGTTFVHVYNRNEVGRCNAQNTLQIPKKTDILPFLIQTKKLKINNTYVISWKVKEEMEHIIMNFTIFWCVAIEFNIKMCDSAIDFKTLPSSTRSYTHLIDDNKTYVFALAANSKNSTTGMKWAYCTSDPTTECCQCCRTTQW